MTAPLAAPAPAKVNLTLRILGRRADGYHDLESLVVFAPFGDRLTLRPGPSLDLSVSGPMAAQAGPPADNLVLRAARALAARAGELRVGHFTLMKRLPAGAGLGGGSSDAAAALRLLAEVNELALNDARLREAAAATGADVPVCLDPRPRMMRGIGDILSAPVSLPRLGLVLVHPGIAVPTAPVFKTLGFAPGERRAASAGQARSQAWAADREPDVPNEREALIAWLAASANDLQAAALGIAPAVAKVLEALAALKGCRLARMSGSGSACFGLFDSARAASAAARQLRAAHPHWWARAGAVGEDQ